MGKKVKWGVIGSGGIARRRTIPEGIMLAKNAQLHSVYDVNDNINAEVANEFSAKESKSVDQLINSGIDAVYIASPVNFHLEHVMAAAKAKKHILCEKPLGLTIGQAQKIVEICNDEGILLGNGFMMRFLSQHKAVVKIIEEGSLGKPVFCRAQLSCWYPPIEDAWRQDPVKGGGGSLMDMGSHCIDLLEMFFGEIESVNCTIGNVIHSYKSEDSAVVTLKFKNGACGVVDSFFCIPDSSSKNKLELYGSRGSILATGTIGQQHSGEMIAYLEEEIEGYNAQQIREATGGIKIDSSGVNAYKAEIEEFSDAIISDRIPLNNGYLGLRNQQIISACYNSAKIGKAIEIL